MALPSEPCAQCRALVAVADMTAHLAWHTALANTTANHPHGPVGGEARAAEKGGKK